MKTRKIALIGFMGCGKSSIGHFLASGLGLPHIDLDEEIEKRAGLSVREIFEQKGEAFFRELERQALASLAQKTEAFVLSCGGGAVLSPSSRRLLRQAYFTVWIDVPLDELLRRLSQEKETRPLLASADYAPRAEALLRLRAPLYASASRFAHPWRPGETAAESASAIAEKIRALT